MFPWELCERYVYSGECSEADKYHFFQLMAATRFMTPHYTQTQQPCDEIHPKYWKQWRVEVCKGGWRTPKGEISKGWSRSYCNQQFRRLQRAYQWGAGEGLIQLETFQKVMLIVPIKPNQHYAREYEPIGPAEWENVKKVQPFVSAVVWDMIEMQYLTGMRNYELVKLNVEELDTSRDVWLYSPKRHKTSWRGKPKTIILGPAAVAIAQRHWPQEATGLIFRSLKGKGFTQSAYRAYVYRAIEKSGCDYWHPHQLRHARAKLIDYSCGREAAAAVLGDTLSVTAVYAQRNMQLAIDTARKLA